MLQRSTATDLDVLGYIEVGLQLLIVKFPLAGLMLCGGSVKIREDSSIGTFATDGVDVFYSTAYVREVYTKEGTDGVLFRLAHEFLHIYLGHVTRRRDRDPQRWNMAIDLITNRQLRSLLGTPIPEDGISSLPGVTADSAEEAYDQLVTLPEPTYSTGKEWEEQALGEYQGDLLDPPENIATLQLEITQELRTVTAIIEKTNPSSIRALPGALRARLEELNTPNSVPWNRLLAGEMLRAIPGNVVDWLSPRRNMYPRIYLPKTRSREETHLVLAVDGSASVHQNEHRLFQASVRPAVRRAKKTTVLCFDERVTETLHITRPSQLSELRYAQGSHCSTSTLEVFDYCSKLPSKPSVLVIETDGYVDHPVEPPPYKVLWVLTEKGKELPWGINYRMRNPWS